MPIDFSAASRAAFSLAAQMTGPWNSELILFHVPGGAIGSGLLAGNGATWSKSDALTQAREHLQSFAETVVPGSGSRVRVEAREDDTEDLVESVAHVCAQLGASLVVMGSSEEERPRWGRSSAERVARAVHCPVLVVPS